MLKEFQPALSRGGDMAMDFLAPATRVKALEEAGESAMRASLAKGMPHGFEVGYSLFSINGRMLGHGEPIRVKAGERVLFHIVNGSATEIRSLALPGHSFEVIALDGNPVPTPSTGTGPLARDRRTHIGGGRDEPSRRMGDGRPCGRRPHKGHGHRDRICRQVRTSRNGPNLLPSNGTIHGFGKPGARTSAG